MQAPECLPRFAKLSDNGRYEILEASIALPQDADVTRATVQQNGQDGIQVAVPMRHVKPKLQVKADRPAASVPKLQRRPQIQLPSSEGLEVVEEDFEYPEKRADACDGWLDNRGEFQSY